MTITIPNSQINADFSIDEITTGTLNGNGVFDKFMAVVKLHLDEEFKKNHIRGTDYANAYIRAMELAFNQATGYALQKAKLPLELQQLEANILKTATDTAVATKQGALLDEQAYQVQAETRQIDYTTHSKLPAEVEHIKAQTGLVITQDAIAEYDLEHKQPIETDNLRKQGEQLSAQTKQTNYQTDYVLPKQLEQTDAQIANQHKQTDLLDFDLTQIKPKELELLGKEVLIKEKQIPLMEKDIELKQNQIELGLKEIVLKEKEIPLKEKQLEIAGKELGIKDQQLKLAQYEFEFKAPAEVGSIKSQTNLYNQKAETEKAQTNGDGVSPNSVIAHNNRVLAEQVKQYQADRLHKSANMMIDVWKVAYADDPDAPANRRDNISKLTNAHIGVAVKKMLEDTMEVTVA